MLDFVFIFRNINVGGAELLISKLARNIIINDNKSSIVYEHIDTNMKNKYESDGINLIHTTDWNNYLDIIKYVNCSSNKVVCITFEWDIFLDIYTLKTKTNKKTIFYAIDYVILAFGYHRSEGLFKKLEKCIIKKCLVQIMKEDSLVCMDEQTVRFTGEYFDLKETYNFKIIRIPIDYIPNEEKINNEKYNILSVARADFPFKGYLVGLVEFMKDTDKNTYLTIVSYGKDINVLENKIKELSQDVSSRIKLIGKVSNDELMGYYKESNLYIGMGTTIIEAAMNKTIAIPVVPRTMELIATHFFHENYREVAIDYCENNKFKNLYDRARRMKQTEEMMHMTESRNLAILHYSSEVVSKQLIEFCDNSRNDKMNCFIRLTQIIRRFIRKFAKIKTQFIIKKTM